MKETLSGKEVVETLEGAGVHHFPDPYVEGFLWGEDGGLQYPGMPPQGTLPFIAACANPGRQRWCISMQNMVASLSLFNKKTITVQGGYMLSGRTMCSV